ncbi:hypothetical protein [Micromonospora sp. NPDC003241]
MYESIGSAYPATRRTEPRIAARVWEALGDARTATAALGVSLQTS